MVCICAKDLYPASAVQIDISNFEAQSQICTGIQDFARGEWSATFQKQAPFRLSEISTGARLNEFEVLITSVADGLLHLKSSEDFVGLVERCPRFVYRHKFIIRWLLAAWRGEIDPGDQAEQQNLEQAVWVFNQYVKNWKSTQELNYTPGVPFTSKE